MTLNPNIPAHELVERERQLRQEILGGSATRTAAALAPSVQYDVVNPPYSNLNRALPAPESRPEGPSLVAVNFADGTIAVHIGELGGYTEFVLNDFERTQFAFIALNVLGRNLQETINTLHAKYEVGKLEMAAAHAAKAAEAVPTPATGTTVLPTARRRRKGNGTT